MAAITRISCTLRFFLFLSSLLISTVGANHGGVFSVKYKYAGQERSLSALKAHDYRRQLSLLAGVDLPLGGSGRPDGVGLYYAKIGIGTPSKDYYLQVDTGSDIMWVNCIQCSECPSRSNLGIDLTLYDIKESSSGKLVPCDQEFCKEINGGLLSGCTANISCPYLEIYGDGSSTAGYFVKDVIQYDQVSGDLETAAANGSVIFGCGARQSGDLSSSNEEALDGILGFGKANSSMISQLASSGKVKKMFAHCLNGVNGGGIFAIGHVVQPKVNVTPLLPDQPHYNVNMTAVQVGHTFLSLSKDASEEGDRKGTIIDSGTTLAYLPEGIYEPLVYKIISQQPDLKVHTLHDEYTCFQYPGSVDDGFPAVTFYFENGLSLKVYPHDYLFLSVVVSTIGLLFIGKLLEPVWGPREFLKFIFVVNFLTSVWIFITAIALYYITRQENYLYMPLSGFHGVISGFLVGIKQIIPDQELPFLKIKMKWLPSITLLCSIAVSFWTLEATAYLPTVIFGTYMSWIYLRYWQRKPETKLKGDPSEDFAFSTFFPEFLRPVIDPIASIFHRMLCGRSDASNDAQGYTLGGEPLPGSDPIEASRRRERGARALEERLAAERLAAAHGAGDSPIDAEENV